jgi:AhpD family alkylhydroperoxidase
MDSQIALNDERKRLRQIFGEVLPEVWAAESGVLAAVYQDGVLSAKVKRLMSLSLALGAGCNNCILGQTEAALAAGATREEILETLAVVTSMRGTTGIAEGLKVIKFLEELGV